MHAWASALSGQFIEDTIESGYIESTGEFPHAMNVHFFCLGDSVVHRFQNKSLRGGLVFWMEQAVGEFDGLDNPEAIEFDEDVMVPFAGSATDTAVFHVRFKF